MIAAQAFVADVIAAIFGQLNRMRVVEENGNSCDRQVLRKRTNGQFLYQTEKLNAPRTRSLPRDV